ncbi:hypothetical protein [Halorarum salinum]|uniref:Uncharacterized protein n=1 Tax=Halorarum salinum TaxID=2743089 RepID=A0A7D5QAR7_9EURY|nr:hypothetical protein [Halobaculum salinum]QLG60501.1 hypothetical protein HUG12_01545 [Halobaculum salinum]
MTQEDYHKFVSGYLWWDEETGTVRNLNGYSVENQDEAPAMWPSDAARLGKWLTEVGNREAPFYIYYRDSYKDHIVQDGDTLCSHTVNVPDPNSDSLKPFPEVTDHEWSLILSYRKGFCNHCPSIARRKEIWPEEPPHDPPSFSCPECGDPITGIHEIAGMTRAEHPDGRSHEIDRNAYQKWRRGETVNEDAV